VEVRAERFTRDRSLNPFDTKLEASAIGRLHDSDTGSGVVECCVRWNGWIGLSGPKVSRPERIQVPLEHV